MEREAIAHLARLVALCRSSGKAVVGTEKEMIDSVDFEESESSVLWGLLERGLEIWSRFKKIVSAQIRCCCCCQSYRTTTDSSIN